MKILIVTQYFWPESFIINNLAKTLVEQGHTIQVLTGKPNYPEGKIFPGYSAKGCMNELFGEIPVYRVPLRPRGKSGAINLALNYLSFVWNGLLFFHRKVRGQSFDIILVYALSPITAVIPAIYLKWKLKSHLAVWVQDLWPESLSATGFIRNKQILYLVGLMVRIIYACTDIVFASSEAFKKPIRKYTSPRKSIQYYPNPYPDNYPKIVSSSSSRIPAALLREMEQNFCVVFAGNLGKAQAVETLISAAEKLKELLPNCKLILVGSGSMSSWIEEQKSDRNLDNLILAGRFPAEEMPHFFSRADGLLVTLAREEIFTYTIPSKVQAYLSSGRPIIAALDGEGKQLIERAGAGLCCPTEDSLGLAHCIEQLFYMPQVERERLGVAGRSYFLENFEIERQSRKLVEIFETRIGRTKDIFRP